MRGRAVAAAIAVALGGCATKAAPRDPKGPSLSDRGISLAPLELRLLSAGEAPREPLRYQLAPGLSETVVLELSDTMKLAVGEIEPPEVRAPMVRLTIALRSSEIDAAGRSMVSGTIAKVEVPSAAEVPVGVTAAVASDLEGLAGTALNALVSRRGYLERLALPTPAGAPAQLATTLERVRQSLRHLWPPLPGEPVGPGATWGVRWRGALGPATVDEWVEYTLSARENGQLRLAIKVTLAASEQTMSVAGMPHGATLTLTSLRGAGTGKAEVTLTRLVQTGDLRWWTSATGSSRPVGEPPAPVRLDSSTALILHPSR